MRIALTELKKLWKDKNFYLLVFIIIAFNALLLFNNIINSDDQIPPRAYRIITSELDNKTNMQKELIVNQDMQKIKGVLTLDYISAQWETNNAAAKQLKKENIEIFEKYSDAYINNNYLKYTNTLKQEYRFLLNISYELDNINNYSDFLTDIENKAEYGKIFCSLSKNEKDYNMQSIMLTAQHYKSFASKAYEYYPQKSLQKALSFGYTDVLLMISIFLVSFLIIWQEKSNGMLRIVLSTQNGRKKTGIAKIIALMLSMAAIIVALYTTNLIICIVSYGKIYLMADIQSYYYLMKSVLPINLLTYIIIFLSIKWLSAILLGLIFMLSLLRSKNFASGLFFSAGAVTIFYLIRAIISPTGKFSALRYLNPISLLKTEENLLMYRNINFFGRPYNLLVSEIIFSIVGIIITATAFIIVFNKIQGVDVYKSKIYLFFALKNRNKEIKAKKLWRIEHKKLMINCFAAFFLLAAVCFEGYSYIMQNKTVDTQEGMYAYYMQNLSGKYTKEKHEFLTQENKKFEIIYKTQNLLYNKKITEEEYAEFISDNAILYKRYNTFNRVINKFNYIKANKNAAFIYDTGFKQLLNTEKGNSAQYMFAVILSILCTSFYGCLEKTNKMDILLRSTINGRKKLARIKQLQIFTTAILITFILYIFELLLVIQKYGTKGIFLPALSLKEYSAIPVFISVLSLIIIDFLFKLVVTTALCMACFAISMKIKKILFALTLNSIIFFVPIAINNMGIKWLKYFTLYSAYDFGYCVYKNTFLLFAYLFVAICLTAGSIKLITYDFE